MPHSARAARRGGPVIAWFRDDLRLRDHPALAAAVASGQPVICIYLLDEESAMLRPLGGAARWWLAGSLHRLAEALRERGGNLVLRRGAAATAIPLFAAETGASTLFMNLRHDPAGAAIDHAVEARLQSDGTEVRQFQANLLHDPATTRTQTDRPFQVFTPFWRHLRSMGVPRASLAAPAGIAGISGIAGDTLASWKLEPSGPDWATGMRAAWTRGEAGADADLATFLDHGLKGYAERRDRPDLPHTSRLSPRLRFGEISPFQVWHAAIHAGESGRAAPADVEKLLSELAWREFCYHLLYQAPALATANFNRRFDAFPWRGDPAGLVAWQRGRTGYPLVDAGMRQLWATGWMHNRVRMVTASFLIKHLLIDWRLGEQWFWDTLVDADAASNPANWQWVAGSGADAAPYFRIFNPILQGEKFDSAGDYVRQFVPELRHLPAEAIHSPFRVPPLDLARAGVLLGKSYPEPIVAHEDGRKRALAALAKMTAGNTSKG